ncbi:MAG: hypothetical protein ABL930_11720, partial [Pseudobdellovibrio sp.]
VFMKVLKMSVAVLITGSFLVACQNSNSGSSTESADIAGDLQITNRAISMAPMVNFTTALVAQVECNFNNTTLSTGMSVTAYQNSSVPSGQTCVSEQRVCSNGTLSGSYNYASCNVDAPSACLFNGATVNNGDVVVGYNTSDVLIGQECIAEYRTCTNGTLSGSFLYASCNINLPTSCLFNGQTISSGTSVAAYTTSSVAFGQTCNVEQRTCDNGTLSGSNAYASCSVDTPASCLFNGQTIADGQTVNSFLNSNEAIGQSCTSQTRTCTNGTLAGSYQFATCVVDAPASCLFNGQTVSSGDTINAYQSSAVEYAQMCIAESRTCDNGHLSGSFAFASCDAGQPASCLFDGQTIVHGATVNAFLSSSVNAGSLCSSEPRTCSNGILSGTNTFSSCTVAAAASCLFNTKTIISGQSIIAYKETKNKKDSLCESETRVCNNGILSGSFNQNNCTNSNCKKDDDKYENSKHDEHEHKDSYKDDDELIKVCKKVVEIKKDEKTCQKYNSQLKNSSYQYKEKYDCGLHLGWYKHKNHQQNCGKHKGWYKHKNSTSKKDDD